MFSLSNLVAKIEIYEKRISMVDNLFSVTGNTNQSIGELIWRRLSSVTVNTKSLPLGNFMESKLHQVNIVRKGSSFPGNSLSVDVFKIEMTRLF
jgi:hypothetical protein